MNEPQPSSPDSIIVSHREFAFPRALVYQAWTNPEHLKNWWGPKGFTNTFHEFDLQPEGKWLFTMHGPDGKNYGNECVFEEIVPLHRLQFMHVSNPRFQVKTTFEEFGGLTLVTFRMTFARVEECRALRDIIVPSNEENFDRLEAELQRMSA